MNVLRQPALQPAIKILKFFFSRVFVIYLLAVLLSWGLMDFDRMKVKMINRVVPASTEALVRFSLDPGHQDPVVLEQYLTYFKTTARVLTKSGAASGLLAYCQYYLGNKPKAIENFRRAITLNPDFFWFQYNLGVILFLQGDYNQAAAVLKEAMTLRPEATFVFINVSRIYKDLNNYAASAGYNTEDGLRAGYRNAQEMVMLCEYRLGGLIQRDYKVQIF